MKDSKTAHFDLVKLGNQKYIRNLLRIESPQSIASLASKASLTYPTVASLLKELERKREVVQSKNLESCGGRPGIQYELDVNFQQGLVLCFNEHSLSGKVFNVYGTLLKEYSVDISQDITVEELILIVGSIHKQYSKLTAISIGIPGVVWENEILYLPKYPKLEGKEMSLRLQEEFLVEVFIENDLNAISMAEVTDHNTFAHITYVNQCIGAGIVINGEIFSGHKGYAGELEYLCSDYKDQKESLITCIKALTCVLNLPLIYVSGENITEEMVALILERVTECIPPDRIPQIVVAENLDMKYEEGLLKKIVSYWKNLI